MKTQDVYNSILIELQKTYQQEEAESITLLLLEEFFEVSKTDIVAHRTVKGYSRAAGRCNLAIQRLKRSEPIQYVLGKAHFYGRTFTVSPDVLIPRRETEELVHLICSNHPDHCGSILDIGTGSGCIPITLKLELPLAKVEALDVSNEALYIAKNNANLLSAEVVFYHVDILSKEDLPDKQDIIISNPPYVMNKEKRAMEENVLNYEPHLALFVEDNDPLVFYHKIIEKSVHALNKGGHLYFEINEQFGEKVAEIMKNAGFQNIRVIKDMQEKDRIVHGWLV